MPFGMIPLTNHHSNDVTLRLLTVILVHPDGITVYIITVYVAIASEKVWEALVQRRRFQRRREGPGEGFGNLWARSGLTSSTRFPALVFAARFGKNCKNKTLRLLGYHRSLLLFWGHGQQALDAEVQGSNP